MTRFIILGAQRVGSNLLVTLLDSHPDCRTKSEVLNNIYPLNRPMRFLRRHFPRIYFRMEAWGAAKGKKAVGVKVFYRQFKYTPKVLEAVRQDKSIRIVHLTRENLLRQYLSLSLAKETKKWSLAESYQWKSKLVVTDKKPEAQPQEPLELSVDGLNKYIQTAIENQTRYRSHFAEHDVLEITYEQLTADRETTMENVLAFLELGEHPIHSPLQKQITRPLSEMIVNYAELKAHFAGSEWAHFFDE